MEITGKVYDIQGFSIQDGPGIRTTVFLKGCPLRCPWCHSPESQEFYTQLSWISLRCQGIEKCGRCLNACEKGAVSPGRMSRNSVTNEEIQLVHINRRLCDNCGACAAVCGPKALFLCGTDYTAEEILERVCRDLPFYRTSGGGVTVSGGEPLCQPQFTAALLRALKERDIHTALDTTGFVPYDRLEAALPYTDLFLYDLKHMDSAQHKAVIGVPNELILENAEKLAAAGAKLQIRIPVIPNFNDSKDNIRKTGRFCLALGAAVEIIQLLPYHNMGVMKYQRLDEDKVVLEAKPPTEEAVAALRLLLEEMGLPVTVH